MSTTAAYPTTPFPRTGQDPSSKWIDRLLAFGMFSSLLLAFFVDKLVYAGTHGTAVIILGGVGVMFGSLLILLNVRAGMAVFLLVGCLSPRMPANLRLEDALVPALILAWLMRMLKGDRFTVINPITVPFILVTISMALSFVWGMAQGANNDPIAGAFATVKRFEYGVLFLFAYNSMRSRSDGRTLLLTFLLGAVMSCAIALGTAGHDSTVGDTRATGMDDENYNTFAGFLVIAASLAIAGAMHYKARLRGLLIVVALTLVATLVKTYSREGYFILTLSILTLGILRYRKIIPLILGLMLLAPLIAPSTVLERVDDSVAQVQNYKTDSAGSNSFTARVTGWQGRWHMVEEQPVMGSGPGSVPLHIDNEYLIRLIEGGIVGITIFVILLFCLGRYLNLCTLRLKGTDAEPFAYGLFAAYVAMLLQGCVAASWSTIRTMEPFWILAGAVGGLVAHNVYFVQPEPVPEQTDTAGLPAESDGAPSTRPLPVFRGIS